MSGDGKCELCGAARIVVFTTADCPHGCDRLSEEQRAEFRRSEEAHAAPKYRRCGNCNRITAKGTTCKCGVYVSRFY